MATTDWPASQYSASGAPLIVGEHVVTGVAGAIRGDEAARSLFAGRGNPCRISTARGARAGIYIPTAFWRSSPRASITKLRPAPFEMGKRYFNGTGSGGADGKRSAASTRSRCLK